VQVKGKLEQPVFDQRASPSYLRKVLTRQERCQGQQGRHHRDKRQKKESKGKKESPSDLNEARIKEKESSALLNDGSCPVMGKELGYRKDCLKD
jgi:hypothetical protein